MTWGAIAFVAILLVLLWLLLPVTLERAAIERRQSLQPIERNRWLIAEFRSSLAKDAMLIGNQLYWVGILLAPSFLPPTVVDSDSYTAAVIVVYGLFLVPAWYIRQQWREFKAPGDD